jgi:hypothetical protein
MLEILFLLLLACVIATFLWYRSFQEFTILQLEYTPLLVLPDERVPIVIREIPMQFKTSWLSVLAKQSSLPVLLEDNTRTLLKEYAANPTGIYHRLTGTELAAKFNIHSKFKDTMMFLAKFWYLPVAPLLSPASLWILPPSEKGGIGLQRSLAERTVLTVHEGRVTVWLSRETVDVKDILTVLNKDPWSLSVKETPFINDLQYIEVILRAGNSLVLPPRSLYGIKTAAAEAPAFVSRMELHSPLSLFISGISRS